MKLFFCGVSAGFYRGGEAPAPGNGLSGGVQHSVPSRPSPYHTQSSRSAEMPAERLLVRERKDQGLTDGFQSLTEVCNNVFRGFRPYGKADEVGPDARFHELFIR